MIIAIELDTQGTSTCPAKHATPSGVRPVPAVAVPRATSTCAFIKTTRNLHESMAALWCWKFSTMSWEGGVSEAQVGVFFLRPRKLVNG